MPDNIQIKDAAGTDRIMRTTDGGGVHTPHHIVSDMVGYDPAGGKLLVGNARDKFRDQFFAFDTVNNWELVQTGAGMAISVAGAVGGARYLNIASGTTINSETIILSRSSYRLPVKFAFAATLSQRIVNQEFFVELVGVDDNGVVETDATFPSPNTLDALNAASWKFDAAVATQAKYLVRGQGVSELLSAASTIGTTAATGTTPNFVPGSITSIIADMEEAVFTNQLIDSLAVIPNIAKRSQYLPDTGKAYKIRIRAKNLGTAPASSTDFRLHFVRILDTTRFTVDFSRNMGRGTDLADALPVFVGNGVTVANASLPVAFNSTVAPAASATGALTKARIMAAASTNATSVKATAGRLYEVHLCNVSAALKFVKFYNKATAPVVGTDIPAATYPIAANGGRLEIVSINGISFATGIAYAITGAVTDADATAVATNDVVGEILYA
jgi:hypothetical protein